jgi:hypothetical protein
MNNDKFGDILNFLAADITDDRRLKYDAFQERTYKICAHLRNLWQKNIVISRLGFIYESICH